MGIEPGQSTLLLSLAGVLPMRLDEKGRDSCDEVELRLETEAKIPTSFSIRVAIPLIVHAA